MIFFGIDPGTVRCGWGVVNRDGQKLTLLDFGCIGGVKEVLVGERLNDVYSQLIPLLKRFQPDCVGIEQIFFAKNVKTVMSIAEVRGVLLLALRQNHYSIMEFTPYQIKQAVTGYGAADKKQVQQMVARLLNLDAIPKPDDAADAVAIAMTVAQSYNPRLEKNQMK